MTELNRLHQHWQSTTPNTEWHLWSQINEVATDCFRVLPSQHFKLTLLVLNNFFYFLPSAEFFFIFDYLTVILPMRLLSTATARYSTHPLDVDKTALKVNGKLGNGKLGNRKIRQPFFGGVCKVGNGKMGNGKLGSGNPGSFANIVLLFCCLSGTWTCNFYTLKCQQWIMLRC